MFERIWERLGIAAVLGELLPDRGFESAPGLCRGRLERAVFASVLHRLFVSGSDRSGDKWITGYQIAGVDGLQLYHFDRAMAWRGEKMAPAAAGALAPRCVKDLIEDRLFDRRRDLFSDLSRVFMDTTSLSFHGAGGESLGADGHAKDRRADLKQMILAVMLQKELADLCQRHGLIIEGADLLRDLDRLQEATIDKDGKRMTTRTAVTGQVGNVFQAAGIALPPNLHERAT